MSPAQEELEAEQPPDSGWGDLSEVEKINNFRSLSPEQALYFFAGLSSHEQAQLLLNLPTAEGRIWLRTLAPDDVADMLQTLEADEDRINLEKLLTVETLREVRALLAYEEDEAGGLMNPRFARIRPNVTVDVAIRYLRQQTQKNLAAPYYAYVLTREQKLLGVVSFRDLFAAKRDTLIDDVMATDVIAVQENTDQETVAALIAQHNLMAVPVLSTDGVIQGVITVDDIVDVVQEEATEDIQKLGGQEALGAPYLNVGLASMVRKRGGWLSALFVGEMLTASAMAHFEQEIARAVVLAMFVPLIISSGGNSGSQAATLVVRALALQEVRLRDWLRVLGREALSGLSLGLWLGFLGFFRVVLWQHLGLFDYGEHMYLLAMTVWISLVGVVTFGTITGSMLPFLLRRLGLDPATSSAPFVATLVDVTGLIIYFIAAAAILSGTIL